MTASQRTLKTAIGCRGIGLHSGQKVTMALRPSPADTGIVFHRLAMVVRGELDCCLRLECVPFYGTPGWSS